MHVMTFNANGIRATVKKGFWEWFLAQSVDVLCIQETKAQTHQLTDACFSVPGYTRHLLDAERPGYSGVAIYTREPVKAISTPLDGYWVTEGRLLGVELAGVTVYSLYLPSGTSGDTRQVIKYQLMDELFTWMKTLDKPTIIGGDWNIAHQAIDLKNWKSNQKNSGFLPEERQWMDQVLADGHWVDSFRACNQLPDQYTWWTYRGQARQKNVGWRIDYQMVNACLAPSIRQVAIHPEPIFSDHAPMSLWLDMG